MDSAEDLKTKDYFQTSAFADSFYSKASTILSGISAREILDKTNEDAYIDLGELYNGDSLSFKNTSGLAYSFNDLREWSSQTIHSNDDWIVLGLTTRRVKQNICTIPISKRLWKTNPATKCQLRCPEIRGDFPERLD